MTNVLKRDLYMHYIHYPDKYLYLLHPNFQLCGRGRGRTLLRIKWEHFFVCPLLLVCQFSTKNLIRHDLWKLSKFGQTSKVSTACVLWDFLLKIGTLRAKDIRKIVLILYEGSFTPFSLTQLAIRIVLLHKIGDR